MKTGRPGQWRWTVAAALFGMAATAPPDARAQFNIELQAADACVIDGQFLQVEYELVIDGPPPADMIQYVDLITIDPVTGPSLPLAAPSGFDCLAGRVAVTCPPAAAPCSGGNAACGCVVNVFKPGGKPIRLVCGGVWPGCRCVLPKQPKRRMARPTSFGGSSTFDLIVQVDANGDYVEINEGDNMITVPGLQEHLLPPCATGACCFADGSCIGPIAESLCIEAAGYYRGDGTDCGSPCPSLGACCTPCGGCVPQVTQDDCDCLEGTWVGAGSNCLGDGNNNNVDDACENPVPAASETWLAIMGVVIVAAGSVLFRRRARTA